MGMLVLHKDYALRLAAVDDGGEAGARTDLGEGCRNECYPEWMLLHLQRT